MSSVAAPRLAGRRSPADRYKKAILVLAANNAASRLAGRWAGLPLTVPWRSSTARARQAVP
jgi:hypothetical protein